MSSVFSWSVCILSIPFLSAALNSLSNSISSSIYQYGERKCSLTHFMEISFYLHTFWRKLDVHTFNSQLPWLGKCQAYLSVPYLDFNFTRTHTAKMTDYSELQGTTFVTECRTAESQAAELKPLFHLLLWHTVGIISGDQDCRVIGHGLLKAGAENNNWCVRSLCSQTWEMSDIIVELTVGTLGAHGCTKTKHYWYSQKWQRSLIRPGNLQYF